MGRELNMELFPLRIEQIEHIEHFPCFKHFLLNIAQKD